MEKVEVESLYYLSDEEIKGIIRENLKISADAVFFGDCALLLRDDGTVEYIMDDGKQKRILKGIDLVKKIVSGKKHAAMLTVNKRVIAIGNNDHGQCDVGKWENVTDLFAGPYSTIAVIDNKESVFTGTLKEVKAVETVSAPQPKPARAVTSISAGENITLMTYSDGTVSGTGDNKYGQLYVKNWTNIREVAAGNFCSVGLRENGTVITAGNNIGGQCDTQSWTDIVAIAAGFYHTVGLKRNGTVLAVGRNNDGQCNVGSWTNIRMISARQSKGRPYRKMRLTK